ncbi:uncharacterized protein LOC131312325 [Rhododendron vialii]|uniref:uncharacterized protein LOC131312325 n=1 Tax=Rhododendron vialii TaxID=182163 RepID=UPI00265FEBA8|nr:uncharacterized protein LOC131312325 [Rhododendron vialii]
MNRPPDRGRGRANTSRGRGKPKVTQADIEAYLKGHKLQFPSLQDAALASTPLSLKEVVQSEEVFKSLETTETIMILEYQDEQFKNDPWEIKSRYLDTMSYPVPEGKYRYIYEAMLSEFGSVEFRHTYESKIGQKSPISYSKAIIKMVIPIHKCGIHPQQSKTLSIKAENGIPVHYNYWDYIEAWTKAFYYQNQRRKHSWFLKICPNLVGQQELPNWFYMWWCKFGTRSDYLIPEVQKELEFFTNHHPQLQETNTSEGKSFLFIIMTFGIPWIWKWDIQFGNNKFGFPVLQRTFQYRWWKGINLNQTLAKIKAATQELKLQLKRKEQSSKKNPFLEISAQIKAKNPSLTDDELVIKTMDYMKNQFLQSVQGTHIADDESMTSAKSNEEDNNPFTCLAGESQDPYEDDGTTPAPTLGDFWDSMTEMMAEQLSSRKGKEKNQ